MKKLLIINYITTVISNLLNRYIHLYWTGPPTFTSYSKCTGRCSIELKNDGGNIISSLHIVSMIFISSLSMWSTFNLLEHISLRKWLVSVSASHIPFGNKSWKANGMSVCINMWQSWLFIPYNLHSSILTSLGMFEAYDLYLKVHFYQGFISSFCTWSIINSLTRACFIITCLII